MTSYIALCLYLMNKMRGNLIKIRSCTTFKWFNWFEGLASFHKEFNNISNCVWRVRLMVHRYHCHSNIWMLVCEGYIVIIIILGRITPNLLHNIVLATLFACFRAAVCFRATCFSFLLETLCMAQWRIQTLR